MNPEAVEKWLDGPEGHAMWDGSHDAGVALRRALTDTTTTCPQPCDHCQHEPTVVPSALVTRAEMDAAFAEVKRLQNMLYEWQQEFGDRVTDAEADCAAASAEVLRQLERANAASAEVLRLERDRNEWKVCAEYERGRNRPVAPDKPSRTHEHDAYTPEDTEAAGESPHVVETRPYAGETPPAPPEDTEYEWRWNDRNGGGCVGNPLPRPRQAMPANAFMERRKKAPRGIRPWPWERVPDEEGTK